MPTLQKRKSRAPLAPISPEERQLMEFWVRLGEGLGFPKSIGLIYGLLFVRNRPMHADECVDLLQLSRSSVGQGLKALYQLGAIRPVMRDDTRKDCYEFEPDLGTLVSNVLRRRLFPAMADLNKRLESFRESYGEGTPPHLEQRLQKLERWREKVQPVLVQLRQFEKLGS